MNSDLLFFDDVEVGMQREFPAVEITQGMVDRHVELYGQDWPEGSVPGGVVPSPLVVGILGGQGGAANWLAIHRMQGYTLRCFSEITVGDPIRIQNFVIGKRPHKYSGEFGHVDVRQEVFNQGDELVYQRDLRYTVWKKG